MIIKQKILFLLEILVFVIIGVFAVTSWEISTPNMVVHQHITNESKAVWEQTSKNNEAEEKDENQK